MVPINVTLYHYDGDNRKISKTLSGGILYSSVIFRESIDFHDPEFTIEETVDPNFNYCEITFINESPGSNISKYYFASVENVREGLSLIRCRLDVLMTYAASIMNLPVNVIRSSDMNIQSPFVPDPKAPFESRYTLSQNQGDVFGSLSSDMILITVG